MKFKTFARYVCFAMMLAFVLLTILACAGCVGNVKQAADGSVEVNLPFMARADKFAVNADSGTGRKLKVYVVNGNAEAVPTEALRTVGSLAVTKGLTTLGKARQTTAQQANARPPTITTPTVDPATGTVLTPVVTQPPPAVIPNY
ncbi:MAG: hypothetical protein WCL08_00270 [Verrucomicrobiota bacterium]